MKFKKISFEQYKKDIGGDIDITKEYNDIKLPQRATSKSAGYDFFSPFSFTLEPNEIIKIPTGIKCDLIFNNRDKVSENLYVSRNYVLEMYIRSSLGFKYQLNLINGTGIVDADYYGNKSNEGHIFIKLVNRGDKTVAINKGDAIAQGIIKEFYLTDDDCPKSNERVGGIGSTSNKGNN